MGAISSVFKKFTGDASLNENSAAKGELLAAGVGAVGAAMLANVASDVVPGVLRQPYLMSFVILSGAIGALVFGRPLGSWIETFSGFGL